MRRDAALLPPAKSLLIRSSGLSKSGIGVNRGLTVQSRRAVHVSPCKFRLSFCGSSEKSPLAIALMAGVSAGLAVGTNAASFSS